MPRKKTTITQTEGQLKTYILELKGGGLRRLTVPANWRVTFGPLIGGQKGSYENHGVLALRFYESENQQRAIFTDVRCFRDASIPIEEQVTKIDRKVAQKMTPQGARDVHVEARVTQWVNPDVPSDTPDEFKRLPLDD